MGMQELSWSETLETLAIPALDGGEVRLVQGLRRLRHLDLCEGPVGHLDLAHFRFKGNPLETTLGALPGLTTLRLDVMSPNIWEAIPTGLQSLTICPRNLANQQWPGRPKTPPRLPSPSVLNRPKGRGRD